MTVRIGRDRASIHRNPRGRWRPRVPYLVGENRSSHPEDTGALAVPSVAQVGDYIIAFAGGNVNTHSASQYAISGSGWTSLGSRDDTHSQANGVAAFGKFIASGDPSSYTFSGAPITGNTGTHGFLVYRGVVALHPDLVTGGAGGSFQSPPVHANWATVGYGSMAVVVRGSTIGNQEPMMAPYDGWKMEESANRWDNGTGVFITYDPVYWTGAGSTLADMSETNGATVGFLLLGADNTPLLPIPTQQPFETGIVTGVDWNNSPTIPSTCEVGDFIVIAGFNTSPTNSVERGFLVGANHSLPGGNNGYWGLGLRWDSGGPDDLVYGYGRFVLPGDPGVINMSLGGSGVTSMGGWVFRGVDPTWPLRRSSFQVIQASGTTTVSDFTAGIKSLIAAFMGENIGAFAPNFVASAPFTKLEHNRFAPAGALCYTRPAGSEIVSGATLRCNDNGRLVAAISELRGKSL